MGSSRPDAGPHRRTAPHSGRVSAVVVPVVLALVLGVGLATRGDDEVYPFAQWAMFSRVPATLDVWTLLIHDVDGQPVDGDPMVTDVPAVAGPFSSSSAYERIDRYARALQAVQKGHEERREEMQRTRRQVERLFGGHDVTYSVVNLRGDPVDLLRGGAPDRVVDLGAQHTR